MKARFINAQVFSDAGSHHFKVRYSAVPDKVVNTFEGDDGKEKTVRLYGEKIFEIKATQEAIQALQSAKSGEIVDFRLDADPSNPRYNICTGLI